MPKMKAHSGAKKRFRVNSNGKVKRGSAGRRHHAWARTQKATVNLRGVAYASVADSVRIRRALLAS
jgi:large subunit ribosomal protein L35